MCCLRLLVVGFCLGGATVSCGARGDELPCRNLLIHMNNSGEGSGRLGFEGEGTALFLCNGSQLEVRDQVSIHMINSTANGLCYTDFSCGNLSLWAGSFAVGARTMNASLFEFLCTGAYRHLSVDAPHISVDAQFDYLEVSRHCKPMSAPVCVNPG